MGKIFCLMGKSSTGKDTIYKMLRDEKALQLQTIVPYTTRPIRAGETEGVEYHFIDEQRLLKLEKEGKVIEQRAYDTIYGIWRYATIADALCLLWKRRNRTDIYRSRRWFTSAAGIGPGADAG